ncbi:hypothetical protein [Halorubrum sp. AJ67]|uniref:hypothetical protein n=1 Tax=Halorubrum sp. AJ67 TaxID=1173487 RepID=UPI0003DDCCD4|nr:hypothetical protein [Halorubrum sp. AJ67]CDK38100.1 hypothetical protein BN903_300 [Halorubrum sp. AJ67]
MSAEFIHDPEGIIVFAEPTTLQVSSGCAESTVTATVLPFSKRNDDSVWAGPDTYMIPEDADFTVLDGLASLSATDAETVDVGDRLEAAEPN